MNWVAGFGTASVIFGISIAYAAYAIGCIYLLNGWGLIPALVPIFLTIAYLEAQR